MGDGGRRRRGKGEVRGGELASLAEAVVKRLAISGLSSPT